MNYEFSGTFNPISLFKKITENKTHSDLLENYLAYLPPIKEQEKFSHAISAYQSLKEKNIKSNKIIKNTLLSFQSQSFGLN